MTERDPLSGFRAGATALPSSAEQLCRRLADAAASGASVLVAGGGCFADLAAAPGPVDILLRTTALSGMVFHEPAELVAKVEGGMTLGGLGRILAERGQELPWDLPWPERQTIGGALASGISGPRGFSAGTPRRTVLGMKVALSDGRILSAGGRVVKNAAGYDLTRLLAGSNGTLGAIIEATVRVRPRPEDSWSTEARFAELKDALGAGLALTAPGFEPSFVELRGASGDWRVHAGAEGLRESVAAQRDRIMAVLGRTGKPAAEFRGVESAAHLAGLAAEPWTGPGPQYRVSVPRSRMARALEGAPERVFASLGSGTARLVPGRESEGLGARDRMNELSRIARSLGGWAVPERCPFGAEDWLEPGVAELNRGVRRAFDPAGVLSAWRGLGRG